jgi:hypothetical protein
MKRTLLLSAVSAIFLGAAVMPASASDCTGFVPPNDLYISVDSPQAKGISELQFNKVIDIVQKLYAPVVADEGGVLMFNRRWTDGTVNASAQQSGNKYIINMYGGLARHETITMDGFALVVCHELGHHIGGAPKKAGWSGWASNEGQSDYYANLKCLRRVFSDPDSKAFSAMSSSDELAVKTCEATFKDADERGLCIRGAMAGKSVAYLFKALRNETVDPGFDTPDSNVVTAMMDSHPATQCRMDTYLQGSLCTQPVGSALSDSDPAAGTCTRSAGFSTGFRPLCWYKPAKVAELLPPLTNASVFGDTERLSPAFSVLQGGYPW